MSQLIFAANYFCTARADLLERSELIWGRACDDLYLTIVSPTLYTECSRCVQA